MNKNGVSPVVGIILLTAVTVALVSLAALFVFDVSNSSSSGVGTATVNAEYESESRIDVQLLREGSSDRVVVQSALGTEYILNSTGESVTLLNQDGNQIPVVLGEKDGERSVLRSVPPRSFTPDLVVSKQDGQGNYSSIQTALSNARDGDIVVVKKDVYYENVDIVEDNITLVGESGTVVADSNSDTSVVEVQASGVRISNIKVNASSNQGGTPAEYAVNATSKATLSRVSLSNASKSDTNGPTVTSNSQRFVKTEQLDGNRTQLSIPETVGIDWKSSYDNGRRDTITDVEFSPAGFIVVTGLSEASDGDYDYYTIKYDTTGTELWSERYDSGASDIAFDAEIDTENNIIVTGEVNDSQNRDYFTIKYNESGKTQWTKRYDSGALDRARALTVDKKDNVIVTGRSDRNSDPSAYTVKYNENGHELWNKSLNPTSNLDRAFDITFYDSEVIVFGETKETSYNYYIAKLNNSNGDINLEKSYDSGGDERGRSVAVDSNGNIITTGWTSDFLTAKFTNAGNFLWERTYDKSGRADLGFGVGVDEKNNVYVVGFSRPADGEHDTVTLKYNKTGDRKWVERYDSGSTNRGKHIAVTRDGRVYVASGPKDGGNFDYLVLGYDG